MERDPPPAALGSPWEGSGSEARSPWKACPAIRPACQPLQLRDQGALRVRPGTLQQQGPQGPGRQAGTLSFSPTSSRPHRLQSRPRGGDGHCVHFAGAKLRLWESDSHHPGLSSTPAWVPHAGPLLGRMAEGSRSDPSSAALRLSALSRHGTCLGSTRAPKATRGTRSANASSPLAFPGGGAARSLEEEASPRKTSQCDEDGELSRGISEPRGTSETGPASSPAGREADPGPRHSPGFLQCC